MPVLLLLLRLTQNMINDLLLLQVRRLNNSKVTVIYCNYTAHIQFIAGQQ